MGTKENSKKFSGSYDSVVTKAQSVQPQYMNDIRQFQSLNSSFTAEFGETLATELNEAINDTSASSHSASIQMKTEEISKLIEEGIDAYKQILYYIHVVFGESKAIDNAFGRHLYRKASRSEKTMITMLNLMYDAANDAQFNTQLVEKLGSNEKIEELKTISGKLTAADDIQEKLKKEQLLVTAARIELYNSIWEKLSKINAAAKIIYDNDPARLAIYRLYDGHTTQTEKDTEESDNQ